MNKLKLVHHKDYLLLVSTPADYGWTLATDTSIVFKASSKGDIQGIEQFPAIYNKIIAHLPLNGSPVLEGVNLLPEIIERWDDNNIEKLSSDYADSQKLLESDWHYAASGFMAGYKAASQKRYSEEDLRRAYNAPNETSGFSDLYPTFEDFLQSISPAPVLPTDFEPTIIDEATRVRVIIMKQGIPVLQGRWIY